MHIVGCSHTQQCSKPFSEEYRSMTTYTPTYSPSYIGDPVSINPNPDSVSPNSRITNGAPGSLGYYWKHHRSGPSFRVGGLALQAKEARKVNSIPSTTFDKPHLAYPLADSDYIYTQQQSGQNINPNYYNTPAGKHHITTTYHLAQLAPTVVLPTAPITPVPPQQHQTLPGTDASITVLTPPAADLCYHSLQHISVTSSPPAPYPRWP